MTGDRARGFPAFPPAGTRRGRYFAQTWWGKAWVKALEDTSLDPEPLRKGRRYAHLGYVGSITISPGRISAAVHDGDHDTGYQTRVFVPRLTDAEWDRFLDEVATKAGHLAALLDRDMPHDLVQAADDAGVPLLPALGDLEPECDCPDWELPCKHAAALCYQVSWLLDADPFVLLLMRGRGEEELLAALQERSVAPEGSLAPAEPPRGVPAAEAYASGVRPLSVRPAAPTAAPIVGLLAVPPAPGVEPAGLEVLIADAAVRARELLGTAEPPPALDVWQDTVRLAATHREPRLIARLRQVSRRRPDDFARAVRAWEYGGAAGLDVLERPWTPSKPELARAEAALAAWEDAPELVVSRNRWTLVGRGAQLRYGRDGRWYPYREDAGEWWPAGRPDRDPAAAMGGI